MLEKMQASGAIDGDKEALEQIIQEATAETRQAEADMNAQAEDDDADLALLKQKLQNTKNMPRPENKDQMIEYLTQRLESAEEAISTCEEIIEHERANRKELSIDLKERNATLKALIESERKNLQGYVSRELESTLEMAVREKEQTAELYMATLNELRMTTKEIEELEAENIALQEKTTDQDQQIMELHQQVEQIGGEVD